LVVVVFVFAFALVFVFLFIFVVFTFPLVVTVVSVSTFVFVFFLDVRAEPLLLSVTTGSGVTGMAFEPRSGVKTVGAIPDFLRFAVFPADSSLLLLVIRVTRFFDGVKGTADPSLSFEMPAETRFTDDNPSSLFPSLFSFLMSTDLSWNNRTPFRWVVASRLLLLILVLRRIDEPVVVEYFADVDVEDDGLVTAIGVIGNKVILVALLLLIPILYGEE